MPETNINSETQAMLLTSSDELKQHVYSVVSETRIVDMHTHLFAPQFGKLNLWGVDELLTYHYLIAEFFRYSKLSYEQFWSLNKTEQADVIWQELFVKNTPLSEATRGVIAVLNALGLDTRSADLNEAREFFKTQNVNSYINRVLDISGVDEVVMTNDPLDTEEVSVWDSGVDLDPRFKASLRIDPILNSWEDTVPKLVARGYQIDANFNEKTIAETRRFLDDWIKRISPLYLAVSLPDSFNYPEELPRYRVIKDIVLPTCREHNISFAMMIGVKRSVNPALRLAGDGVGRSDIRAVERICSEFPMNRFLVTMLSRENQHELCVVARKFSNLLPFGCWWFLNNPSIIEEMTAERIELLGASFVPQHSDARVLDQLIYKWQHSRRIISEVLFDNYDKLLRDGRAVTSAEISRDAKLLLADNFRNWVKRS
jgi:hypothetical protein